MIPGSPRALFASMVRVGLANHMTSLGEFSPPTRGTTTILLDWVSRAEDEYLECWSALNRLAAESVCTCPGLQPNVLCPSCTARNLLNRGTPSILGSQEVAK